MGILLQSTAGGFSDAFRQRLPLVEQAMKECGLDPEHFIISKDNAATSNARPLGPFFYDYTVFVDDTNFTVTEPNDSSFLDYFAARILSASQPFQPRRRGIWSRFMRWMSQPAIIARDNESDAIRPTSRKPH